ncbi:MAG: nucleotide-binding protein [Gammaproteobacteria bacterium]
MGFKITGLDKLQKDLKDAERAFCSLDGTIATLHFDPHEPASVLSAIGQMEKAIDEKTLLYRGNAMVESIAAQMKEEYRQQIEERAALARSEKEASGMSESAEELPTILRHIENIVNDLRWADRSSFNRHIKKLSRLLQSPELKEISAELTQGIDLEAWLKEGEATQGGMVGSAELEWPDDHNSEIGTVILLVEKFAEEPGEALDFAHTFYYNGNKIVQNLQNMTGQVLVPFARDYIEFVKQKTGVVEATLLPTKTGPAPRKVFVVHGHDGEARESIARFLEKLGFEPIILYEQANQGRTIIEKVEAHSDVGFAVVLLTPDDEGNAKGQKPQARARQNVILELGYFIGRLGRSRVMALKQGELEIPSDFHGVVYESLSSGEEWKRALGRELESAGFEIDWNKVMK